MNISDGMARSIAREKGEYMIPYKCVNCGYKFRVFVSIGKQPDVRITCPHCELNKTMRDI